jgi:hypothetical protein
MSAYRTTTHETRAERAVGQAQDRGYVYSHRSARLTAALGPWLGLYSEQQWNEAMFRASYYRWCAQRGMVDRDPVTGREMKGWRVHEQAARVADLALCRYWLGVARRIQQPGEGRLSDAH